jgi:hypothetical protein
MKWTVLSSTVDNSTESVIENQEDLVKKEDYLAHLASLESFTDEIGTTLSLHGHSNCTSVAGVSMNLTEIYSRSGHQGEDLIYR